jgi:MFS family permease
MIGGVLSDIYNKEERNTPMAVFTGAAFVGTGLGPMVSGFIAQNASWRWIYYCQAMMSAVVLLLVGIFFRETRGNVLLRRKARALNQYYDAVDEAGYHIVVVLGDGNWIEQERFRWKAKEDGERETLGKTILVSLRRPFRMSSSLTGCSAILTILGLLLTEPVVFMFSLWISFSYAILYLQFDSILLVYQSQYGFSIQQSCAVFAGMLHYSYLIPYHTNRNIN